MKILKKIKKRNLRCIYFLGKEIYSYKKGEDKDFFEIYEYLKKYKYVLENVIEDNQQKKSSNLIWQYWGQGEENAPDIVKACFKSVKRHCKNQKIQILNDSNLKDYIDIPVFIEEKLKNNIISKTLFSDYVRTCLLLKYGGTWIDATVYLTDNIPKIITDTDFFVFKSSSYSDFLRAPTLNFLEKINSNDLLCMSSWFIFSKNTNNVILKKLKILFEEYFKNENSVIDYFLYHYLFTILVQEDEECNKIYNNIPTLTNTTPHLLQYRLFDDYDEKFFGELKTFCSIHKLTYKFNDTPNNNTYLYKIMNNQIS